MEIFRIYGKKWNWMLRSDHGTEFVMLFVLMIRTLFIWIQMYLQIKCNICNSVYVGETKRHLLVHQHEHLSGSILTETH